MDRPQLLGYLIAMGMVLVTIISLSIWFQTVDNRDYDNAQFWIGSTGVWGMVLGSMVLIFGSYFIQISAYNFFQLNNETIIFFKTLLKVAQQINSKLESITSLPGIFKAVTQSIRNA